MAKNITLLGADYPDVPAVQLPKTGGGTATFYDIEVIDNLNSDSSTDALSAKQGKVLNQKIADLAECKVVMADVNNVAIGNTDFNVDFGSQLPLTDYDVWDCSIQLTSGGTLYKIPYFNASDATKRTNIYSVASDGKVYFKNNVSGWGSCHIWGTFFMKKKTT